MARLVLIHESAGNGDALYDEARGPAQPYRVVVRTLSMTRRPATTRFADTGENQE
jgi:hypothetical protein